MPKKRSCIDCQNVQISLYYGFCDAKQEIIKELQFEGACKKFRAKNRKERSVGYFPK